MDDHTRLASWLAGKFNHCPVPANEAANVPVVFQWLNDIVQGKLVVLDATRFKTMVEAQQKLYKMEAIYGDLRQAQEGIAGGPVDAAKPIY